MSSVFLISDTHFGHANILNFLDDNGEKIRPFATVDEMDELMIERWNSVVGQFDKVYHLGDVVMNKKFMHRLARLNGKKVLIKGNHDIFKLQDYTPYFYDIRSCHVLDRVLLSHIPVHVGELGRFRGNIHGHLHQRTVLALNGNADPRYVSVCVEQINYTPIELTEALNLLFD